MSRGDDRHAPRQLRLDYRNPRPLRMSDGLSPERRMVARAWRRAFAFAGMTAADVAERIDAPLWEVNDWLSGARRPHTDRLFAIGLGYPFVVAVLIERGDLPELERLPAGLTLVGDRWRVAS